jgi:hypothetical protein
MDEEPALSGATVCAASGLAAVSTATPINRASKFLGTRSPRKCGHAGKPKPSWWVQRQSAAARGALTYFSSQTNPFLCPNLDKIFFT